MPTKTRLVLISHLAGALDCEERLLNTLLEISHLKTYTFKERDFTSVSDLRRMAEWITSRVAEVTEEEEPEPDWASLEG